MLKSDLIYNITHLPSATRLFDSIRKIELPNLMSDTEFRDSILKQYQSRKCNFEIVKYEDLPENCRKYIEFIEKELNVPITMVSNGPGRNEIIMR